MREIRTYGLMRGCWPERFVRRVGVYSTELSEGVQILLIDADRPSRESPAAHADPASCRTGAWELLRGSQKTRQRLVRGL